MSDQLTFLKKVVYKLIGKPYWEPIGDISSPTVYVDDRIINTLEKKLDRLGGLHYYKTVYAKGRHYIYKLHVAADVQGGSYCLYRKKRKR